jgi:hypothetical protein
LEVKINELQTVITSNLDRSIRDFMEGYQPKTKIEKHVRGDLIAEPQSILAAQRNYCSLCSGMYTWLMMLSEQIYTAEPLVHEPSMSEGEMAIENLKRHKSSGIYQISAEPIK